MSKLSDVEIINFLKKMLQLNVTREQLKSPNTELVISIYTQFLREFNIEIIQPDIMACANISNIEYKDKAIVRCNICRAVAKSVSAVGIDDLTLHDILMPTRKRTLQIISALCAVFINHIKLKDVWMKKMEDCVGIHDEKQMAESRVMELKHALEEKSMLLSSLKNKTIGKHDELANVTEIHSKKRNEAEVKTEESKEIKSRILNLQEKLSEIDLKVSVLKENQQKLVNSIIRSPMKMIDGKNDLEKQLEQYKEEEATIKDQHSNLLKRFEFYKANLRQLKEWAKELRELIQLFLKIRPICEELDELNKECTEIEQDIRSTGIQMTEIEQAKQTLQMQNSKGGKNFTREHEVNHKLLEGLKEKLRENENFEKHFEKTKKIWVDKLHSLEVESKKLDNIFVSFEQKYANVHKSFLDKKLQLVAKFAT